MLGMLKPPRPTRRVIGVLRLLVVAGALLVSWPTSLGGQVSYVQVSGQSMYPTYRSGDLVVTRSQSSYDVGDAIVYRVPKGDVGAGAQVVHRIVGGDENRGLVMQGDNNDFHDQWKPRRTDVVGEVVLHVPSAGKWLGFVLRPVNLGILCGTLTMVSMLWPRGKRQRARTAADVGPAAAPAAEPAAADL